jgi:hypothetical protein
MNRNEIDQLWIDKTMLGLIAILAMAGTLILTACGTTSNLEGAHGEAVVSPKKFSKVTVQDFKVSMREHADQAAASRVAFPDLIANEIKKTGRFSSVTRNGKADANTIVISGVVTKYDEGSASKRFWVGMGFGMAFLEADVQFRDSKGGVVGTVKVDKHSWPMGGGLGAGQNPQSFMNGAADKIAAEAAKLAK